MIHSLRGAGKNGNGFTALSTTIETPDSSVQDADYVKVHPQLKYLRKKAFVLIGFLAFGFLHQTKSTNSLAEVIFDA